MLNIRTFLPSTQLLSEIIEEREIDIMSLTETNLNEDTPNENISIENYNIIQRFKLLKQNKRWWSIIIY
jgi:hypothetical protein